MFSLRIILLTTGLTTNQRFFNLIDARLGALFAYVVVDMQDHFFVTVTHPLHGLFHIDSGVHQVGAVSVPEVMRPDIYGLIGRQGLALVCLRLPYQRRWQPLRATSSADI